MLKIILERRSDLCSILIGHTRQGLRCRICKLNAHGDCASQLPQCQSKSKLLRRQKTATELENRVDLDGESKSFLFFLSI